MELQLGLALANNFTEGRFDLNSHGTEPMGVLGSDPLSYVGGSTSHRGYNCQKRSFGEAFEEGTVEFVPQTLPLLVWNKHPNQEQDDHSDLDKNSSTISKSDGEDDGVVGWPPIKTLRRKLCHQSRSGGGGSGSGSGNNNDNNGSSEAKSTYVKVKMEGVAIARKVDLSVHNSYESLKYTLVGMFVRGQEIVKAYKLAYQDREGDWLLAGDVPWSSFIQSVQRLKLLRSCD